MVDSVWMFTTAGRTLCATMTTGVRRAALTLGGIGARPWCGWRSAVICDSVGRHAKLTMNRRKTMRTFFMRRILVILSAFMRLHVIYNPTAGRGRAQRKIRLIEEELTRLGGEVTLYATRSPEDLT